jgi:hypothetical protein
MSERQKRFFPSPRRRRASRFVFIQGAKLPDPTKTLSGSGNQTRSLRLENAEVLSRPEVEELIEAALALGKTPMPKTNGYTVIKSVSDKQRPRRIVTKR